MSLQICPGCKLPKPDVATRIDDLGRSITSCYQCSLPQTPWDAYSGYAGIEDRELLLRIKKSEKKNQDQK